MQLGGRDPRTIVKAAFERRHYHALRQMFTVSRAPIDFLVRYLRKSGQYPIDVSLRTPSGAKSIQVYSHDDLLTVNEIFFREDYYAPEHIRFVVDIGSNIGISALYFLSRNDHCRVFCYEPVPRNGERLKANLREYEGRYLLEPICVGLETGTVEFGVEETGRYGGVGIPTERVEKFPCREINEVLADVFEKRGIAKIDVLKMDIEGLDWFVLQKIKPEYSRRIDVIYAEIVGRDIKFPGFRQSQRGLISRWEKI